MSVPHRESRSAAPPACRPSSVRAGRARPSVPKCPPQRRSQKVAQELLQQSSVLDSSSWSLPPALTERPLAAPALPFALGLVSYPITLDEAVARRVAQYCVSTAWLGKAGA